MKKRILLVEPYPELSEVMARMMTEAGYEVHCAMSAHEMRKAIETAGYHCILLNLDQNRTEDFGLELAEEASRSGSRIVMIPDWDVDRKKIADKGWQQLTKPFSIADLQATIEQALGSAGEPSAVADRAKASRRG
jgi:DNA-binding response OmpR family regulator